METTRAAACAILAVLAFLDLHTRRLPNTVVAAFAVLYFVHAGLTAQAALSLATHALAGVIALGVGALIFRFGWLGGGDVKLAGAVFLWAGSESLTVFVIVSLCGLLVALAVLAAAQLQRISALAFLARRLSWIEPARGVPYGVALAVGGFIAVLLQAAVGLQMTFTPLVPASGHQTGAALSILAQLA
ncbi:hypothetical protein BZM27_22800 [Paraburkholderia steynii]|uniref:Prepilin type IV endopeptidase peptidase domain-containing protein n=1 Tax=Paraburkholderia steynii TaxID=1245441 RepID=A0A4V2NH04_9BURK|nr:hypothetical protein BZM27_22800 [Paraburkholderia steynii]